MTAVVALVDARHHLDPRLYVAIQSPLLLVDEGLHVHCRQLVRVLFQRHLADGPLTNHRQRYVLQQPTIRHSSPRWDEPGRPSLRLLWISSSKDPVRAKGKSKGRFLLQRHTYAAMPRPAALYNRRKWQFGSAILQLQRTPPPQSTTPGLHPVSIHQMGRPCEEANIRLRLTTQCIDLERMKGWVDLGGWLHTEIQCRLRESNPDTITHPSTNRARRRVTSLIRPTPLPLRHCRDR